MLFINHHETMLAQKGLEKKAPALWPAVVSCLQVFVCCVALCCMFEELTFALASRVASASAAIALCS